MGIEVVVSVWVLFVLMDVVGSPSQYCSYLFLMFPFFSKKIKCCKQKWWIGWCMRDQALLKPKLGFPSMILQLKLAYCSIVAWLWDGESQQRKPESSPLGVQGASQLVCLVVSSESWSLQMYFSLLCRYERQRFF